MSKACLPSLVLLAWHIFSTAAFAQSVRRVEVGDDGAVKVVEEAVAAQTKADDNAKTSDKSKKKSGNDKKDGDKSDNEEDKQKEDDDPNAPVKRSNTSDRPAAAIEDEVRISEEGMVTFNLRDQPWEVVLQWIADSSQLSFDWLELPGDALNLTTTRAYTLDEARDILNRHLLARGYTMVVDGELMSVMKLADVKSSLVPRVTPEQLASISNHTLCKMSFDLDWLIADEVVQEVAPLLSNAGKISKMSRTNRLEIMDTAASLRDIYSILQEEQSDTGQEQLVRTFHLKHRRAEEVIVLLRDLLGVDPPPGTGGGGGRSSGEIMQMANVMKQMTQQLQRMGNSAKSGGSGGREPIKTRLVLNPRENMILVQAMPDQMTIVEKALIQIDVPTETSNSLLKNINRVKVYRLETVNPQTVVDLLLDMGDMAPGTVLKVDSDKKAIVAVASLADHLTITSLVERLDQSARQVEVIPLRRLEADYVAGTIRALMAPPEKQQNTNSRYSYYRYSYGNNDQKNEEDKKFKVEADIENNRLLVYANKVEMDEIYELLQKLGEIPDPDSMNGGPRVFDLSPGENPQDVIDRIQQLWKRNNKIEFDAPAARKRKNMSTDEDEPSAPAPKSKADTAAPVTAGMKRPRVEVWPPQAEKTLNARERFVEEFFDSIQDRSSPVAAGPATRSRDSKTPAADSDWHPGNQTQRDRTVLTMMGPDEEEADAPPVRISLTPDGQLIVTSDDKEALLEIEELIQHVAQPAPKYRVYTLKYATPSWLVLQLKDYFRADEEIQTNLNFNSYYGYYPSTSRKNNTPSLGRRRTPTFIYDNYTSTILVRDADRKQLREIEELIELYDAPEPTDTRAMRVNKIFRLKNSRAEVVAQAVKDVFRDLLSANDKALQKNEENKSQTRIYSYFGNDDGGDDDAPIKFQGLLSIGVDPTSDTLVVSAKASLMDTITDLIVELDKAGETTSSLQVLRVDSSVDLQLIQDRLNKALGTNSSDSQQDKRNKNGQETGNGVPVGSGSRNRKSE